MPLPVKYIKLDDFTPGIVSYSGVPTQVVRDAIPGVASETNTYRCIGLPGKGLGPLPGYSLTNPQTIPTPSLTAFIAIVGVGCIGPVFQDTTTWTVPGTLRDELHVGVVYLAGGVHKFSWYSILADLSGGSSTLRASVTSAIGGALSPTPASFIPVRVQSSSSPTNVTMACSWQDLGLASSNTWFFPNPANPTSATPLNLSRAGLMFAHQGRLIQLVNKRVSHGNLSFTVTNECLDFTAPSLGMAFGSQNMLMSPTSPSGYGSWCSLGDQGFLLIKRRGGAVVIQGDINDQPGIVYQPNVDSTGQVIMPGISTPDGVFYADQRCVYKWDGQGSSNVSRQLKDGAHIRTGATMPFNIDARYLQGVYWNDCIAMPNNLLYSLITKSWWNLNTLGALDGTLQAEGQMYALGSDKQGLWAFPSVYNQADTGQIKRYDPATPAANYAWTSQPISVYDGRRVEIREIELVAQALAGSTSFVEVTLTPQPSAPSVPVLQFILATGYNRIRLPTACQGYNITLQIKASSNTTTIPAPVIHSIALGVREAQSTAAT